MKAMFGLNLPVRPFPKAIKNEAAGPNWIPESAVRSGGISKKVDGLDANVLMAPILWILRSFTQAQAVVQKRRAGEWHTIEDHPAAELLSRANPYYDGDALMKGALLSFCFDGTSYMLKARGGLLDVRELWYEPHWTIEPKWPRDNSVFISHYELTRNGTKVKLRPDDVIPLRFGLDPRNPRKGLSPLKVLLREIMTDEEASVFAHAILSNMGVPGGVLSPESGEQLPSEEDVIAMKEYMKNFRGNDRGEWLALGTPTKVQQFGFDPNRLQLGSLRDISEERVCAVLGVPAAVVGFGAGLQQTKVGATMRELVRLARVNCIEPMQNTIARQLNKHLLPEFESKPQNFRIVFDNSDISMFQEDETERAKRAGQLVKDGVITVSQGQAMAGQKVDESQAYYLRPLNMHHVKAGEEPTDPSKEESGNGSDPSPAPSPDPAERISPRPAVAAHLNGGKHE